MVSLLLDQVEAGPPIPADRIASDRVPTPEEIGKALRISKKKVNIVAKAIQVNNLTPRNENSDEDGGFLIDDALTDDRVRAPEDLLGEADDLERIFRRIGQLEAPRGRRHPDAVRPGALQPDDPPRDRREPRPDPRARPPARNPPPSAASWLPSIATRRASSGIE